MNLLTAATALQNLHISVFTSQDAATLLNVSISHATHILRALDQQGILLKLSKGLWGFTDKIDRLAIPGYLSAPLPAYISLLTALQIHGVIEQIPETVYAVSPARTKKSLVAGTAVSIHHIDLSFFIGYEEADNPAILIATPEKALIDYLYLKPARGAFFKSLPEIDLKLINSMRAFDYIEKIHYPSRKNMVRNAFLNLMSIR